MRSLIYDVWYGYQQMYNLNLKYTNITWYLVILGTNVTKIEWLGVFNNIVKFKRKGKKVLSL